jgi:hemerythrin-like domain-containing protein
MNTTEILDLMVQDHAKLIKYLSAVEKNLKENPASLLSSFYSFEWHLQKHIFVEERAIFSFYNPSYVGTMYEKISDIKKQHNSILKKLDSLKNDLKNQDPLFITDFKRILVKHKNYEETNIYPVLDQEITEGEKRFIMGRIREIK